MKNLLLILALVLGMTGVASAGEVPNLDAKAYCKQVGEFGGGSAVIERECQKEEAKAKKRIERMEYPAKAGKYCLKVAKMGGGSYVLFEECLKEEMDADAELE